MNEPDALRLPTFTFPWPDACSPHAEAVEEHVIEWAEDQQLLPDDDLRDRTIRARYGWMAARCYPAASLERLKTIADYIIWLFLVDDLCFDRVQTLTPRTLAHITAFIDVLDLNTTQPTPLYGERALLDICQRLRQQLDRRAFVDFAQGTRMAYSGAAMQTLAHLSSEPITLGQYTCIRRHSSAVFPCIALLDSPVDAHLESHVRLSNELAQLRESANAIISLSNDIFSLDIELRQPGQYMNMVTLLTDSPHELQKGIDLTAKIVRDKIEHFTQLSEQLFKHANPVFKHYIQGLRSLISGHQRWVEYDTARYCVAFSHCDADQRSIARAIDCTDSASVH